MNKRNIAIIAIVLLLIFGTGTFVFANSSENLENIPTTSGTDQSVKQIDSSKKKQEIDKSSSVSSEDQSLSTPMEVIEKEEEPKKTVNSSTVNNKDYGSGTKVPSVNPPTTEDNKQEEVGGNGDDVLPEVPENPGDNNTGDNEENKEPENDDFYAIALEALTKAEQTLDQNDIYKAGSLIQNVLDTDKKSELQNRLDVVQNIVDATLLVKQLEQKVNDAKNLTDVQEARVFRTMEEIVKKVNALPESNKQNLLKILTILSKVLDDTSIPTVDDLPDEIVVNRIEATKENEKKLFISFGENRTIISDENPLTILLDGKAIKIEELNNNIPDGIHTLIIRDSAYNEMEITFTMDTKKPIITGIENNKTYKIGDEVKVVVEDENVGTIHLEKDGIVVSDYNANDLITKDGKYTVYAIDKAGNVSATFAFTVDMTLPTANISYNIPDATNQDVIATLVDKSEEIKVINNEGKDTYAFTENGEFAFEIEDLAGNRTKVTAKVDWIDKTAPTATISYSTTKLTNGDVVATLVDKSEEIKVINNEGKDTYTFTENGEFAFEIEDLAGNRTKITAKVDWIDKTAPTATISYSTTKLTNGDVVATVVDASKEIKIINNSGSNTYTFTENGKFIFEIEDLAGNKGTVTANVSWIDKIAPTATISYSTTKLTNGDVVATLVDKSEEIKVINNEGKDTYIFTESGEFIFEIEDLAGNRAKVTANVDWIDKTAPVAFILYSTTELTNKDVVVSLINASEEIKVINNEGKDTYTFTENGEFTFEIEDLAGNKETVTANVSWIDKKAPIYTGLGILNFSHLNTTESLEEAKDGDEVLVFVTFAEKLAVLPTITINNVEIKAELDTNYSTEKLFVYTAKYTIDENNIGAGEIQFRVSDYADNAGNIGSTLINTDIKTNDYAKVVVEMEKGFEFIDEGSFSNGVIVIKNPDYSYLEIIDWGSSNPTKPIVCRSTTCKLTRNGLYTFTLYDKNKKPLGDPVTMVYDSISPVITATGLNGTKKEKVVSGVEYTSVTMTIEDDLASIKKVFNNRTEEIQNTCKYDENRRCVLTFTQGGDYKIIAADKAGNTTTIEFSIKQNQKQTLASAVLSIF